VCTDREGRLGYTGQDRTGPCRVISRHVKLGGGGGTDKCLGWGTGGGTHAQGANLH